MNELTRLSLTITLPVPADTTLETFYEKIRKALFEEDYG